MSSRGPTSMQSRGRVVAAVGLWLAACSVQSDTESLPCPCAPSFVCIDGRCVRGQRNGDGGAEDRADSTPSDRDATTPARDAHVDPSDVVLGEESGSFTTATAPALEDRGGALRLRSTSREGEYVSAVLRAPRAVQWHSLRWTPRAPYSKPPPPSGMTEAGYARDNLSMVGAQVLLRMDDAPTVAVGQPLADASGLENHCVVAGSAPARAVAGPYDGAMVLGRDTYCYWPVAATSVANFGTGEFTWAAWVRTSDPAEATLENRIFLGGESLDPANPHIWLGVGESCNGDMPGATLAAVLRTDSGSEMGMCGGRIVNDGIWHHVALTKVGHNPGEVRLYVDGGLDRTAPTTFTGAVMFRTAADRFNVAAFNGGGFPTNVELDDVTVLHRALTDVEVRALHRRGALRVQVQVRACATPDCRDAPFEGPRGPDTWFTDSLASTYGPPVVHALDPSEPRYAGEYVQFRVRMASDVPGESPEIERIEAVGR